MKGLSPSCCYLESDACENLIALRLEDDDLEFFQGNADLGITTDKGDEFVGGVLCQDLATNFGTCDDCYWSSCGGRGV